VHVAGHTRPWLPAAALSLGFLPLRRWVPGWTLVALTAVCWLALWRLPVLDSLLQARLMLPVYLLVGALVAIFLDGLRGLDGRRVLAGAGAVAVALLPLAPRLPYQSTGFQVPAFFAPDGAVARVPEGSVMLVAPVTTYADVDAMLWQASAGMRFRMPEGYVFVPAGVNTPPSATAEALEAVAAGRPPPAASADAAIRSELAGWHVRTVVVGPMPNRDATVALLTGVLGRPPESVQGVSVWWDVGVRGGGEADSSTIGPDGARRPPPGIIGR
jgi:dolichyl-phosphate beta-glucosyltransferase